MADISKINNGTTTYDIKDATSRASAATNAASIATNTANIATNTASIATNTANIATNTASIATNTANIAKAGVMDSVMTEITGTSYTPSKNGWCIVNLSNSGSSASTFSLSQEMAYLNPDGTLSILSMPFVKCSVAAGDEIALTCCVRKNGAITISKGTCTGTIYFVANKYEA